ncbi:MAG: uroporphyrinogen decarboxylase [Gammaproteobacteria bacterium]|nr:uroporphyrinogen decarboxylase [Gammaproteobacteria bacterium]TDJ11353.1 MAG: uroporphyrinogen decarboxylase [Gammaproteobacteria bacterium]
MSQLKNDLLLRALLRKPVERTPVWFMRQAGRYLPEYREIRKAAGGFMDLCRNPELACKVTVQPLRRFQLDAAILFSDILTVPDAMGLGLYFEAGEGPRFERPVQTAADIKKIGIPDPDQDLGYVMQAIRVIREELDGQVPLIGFAGSPWTVATYAVEGGSSKKFPRIKGMLYEQPAVLHKLMEKLTSATIEYLNAQINAGVQAVMVFDTWGGILNPAAYREFSLRYMRRICENLVREKDGNTIPVILFTKGAGSRLADMADTGCDALGVDWTTDLADARKLTGDRVALQGNLDPSILYAGPAAIRKEVEKVLASYGHGPGHVFNLGHGIHPEVDPASVTAMVSAVHDLSPVWHKEVATR